MLARSAISIRKTDTKTQKSVGSIPAKVLFAHQLTVGDTGFSLLSLTTPTSAMPGFSNPSTVTLAGAQMYLNQTGVTLYSSVKGALCPKSQFVVASNYQINFVDWTAEDTEWIWGTIDSQKPGLYFVDATQICLTSTLTAGTQEVVTGAYPLNMFPTQQVGAITVYLDGVQQFRNSGNAVNSPTADGNYYETGSSIIFNTTFPLDASVLILSTGLLVNNPADSRDAGLDLLSGQMDIVVADLALATGNPLSRYQTNPNKVDLVAFGTRLIALEKNTYITTVSGNVAAKDRVLANTSGGAFARTLPASPAMYDAVEFYDYAKSWGTYNFTIARNGKTIAGLASDLICNVSGGKAILMYDGTSNWILL
jgi:hypothetical protein